MKTLIKLWSQLEHSMGNHCNITDIINFDLYHHVQITGTGLPLTARGTLSCPASQT